MNDSVASASANTPEDVVKAMSEFALPNTRGITSWITERTDKAVLQRLAQLDQVPLSKVQLNQLLALSHEGIMTDDFFRYYWLSLPDKHPYRPESVVGFRKTFLEQPSPQISSVEHLKWGLRRLYIDALLVFGNVRFAYRAMRGLAKSEIERVFEPHIFDTTRILERGVPLEPDQIARDDRYLISEMACKSLGNGSDVDDSELRTALLTEYKRLQANGRAPTSIRELLDSTKRQGMYATRQGEFDFSAQELTDVEIASERELELAFGRLWQKFSHCRKAALENTRKYLSMVNDLDVYVATSMRSRDDFRKVADHCHQIFHHDELRSLSLRYFDPTLSAAAGHEDKGLIECLMVRCAKVLLLIAGDRDSYGKDAEAAMALSQGKPVIFLCDEEQRKRFYRDVHPLSRLIDFKSGNVVGALVTAGPNDAVTLLKRIFTNTMEFELEKATSGSLRLKDRLTQSVVRLQTGDQLLNETFWNNYHNRIQ